MPELPVEKGQPVKVTYVGPAFKEDRLGWSLTLGTGPGDTVIVPLQASKDSGVVITVEAAQ